MVFRGVVQYFNTYLTQWIGQRTIFDLRMEVFEHLQRLGLQFFDRNPIGRLITRVTNDIEVLNEMFSSGIVMVFSDVFTIIGILYFMFSMNWQLALFSLSVLPLLFYGTFLFRKKAREAYRDVRLHIARINTFMQEHITGMMVDQIFNREEKRSRQFEGINAQHRDANIKSIFYYALFYPGVDLIGAIAVGLIIWYAGLEPWTGRITIGTVMAFLQFNEMFWRPIRDLSEKYNIMQTAMASSERVFRLLDDHDARAGSRDSRLPCRRPRGHRIPERLVRLQPGAGLAEQAEWVLRDVSFPIQGRTRRRPLWGTPAREKPPSSASLGASTRSSRGRSSSTGWISGMIRQRTCASTWRSCCRMSSSSPGTSSRISDSANADIPEERIQAAARGGGGQPVHRSTARAV